MDVTIQQARAGRMPRSGVAGGLAAGAGLLLGACLALSGCKSGAMATAPEESPLLADLVDYRAGLQMLREGRVDEAIELLRRSRTSHPRDPNVPNALGLALLYKKDYAGATKAFTDALKLDPSLVEANINRGVTALENGKLEAAEQDFQLVLDNMEAPAQEKQNARYNMGIVQLRRKKPADAEREFSLLLADNPLYRTAYRGRGIARREQENFREALEDLLKVLKDDPKDAIANYNAALCLIASGRRDLAVRYMERAVEAAPESDEGKKAKRFLDAESLTGGSTR